MKRRSFQDGFVFLDRSWTLGQPLDRPSRYQIETVCQNSYALVLEPYFCKMFSDFCIVLFVKTKKRYIKQFTNEYFK